jgi:hypothetical protein
MKSKVSVILLGILIFLLGGVAGAVSHYLYREHVKRIALKASQTRFDVVEALAKQLKLDPQQKESLRLIINEGRQSYISLSMQFKPKYETIRNDSDQKIRNILRNDQKQAFEDFLRKFQPPAKKRTPANKEK